MQKNFCLIAPYAAWMVLMMTLPSTAGAYAVRGLVSLTLLFAAWVCSTDFRASALSQMRQMRSWWLGFVVGLVVLAVWMAPGLSPSVFSGLATEEVSPYDPAVCGWPLTLAKLAASAFVISVAEELFFRKWLVGFAGFGWMVALFAVNHWRWDLAMFGRLVFVAEGAFAGLAYGLLARRFGLLSSIVAHSVTNLVLGIVIIRYGQWQFW